MARKGVRIRAGRVQRDPGRFMAVPRAERVQWVVAHPWDRSVKSPEGGRPTSIAGAGGHCPHAPARFISCQSSSGMKPSLCLILSHGVHRSTTIPKLSPRGRWTSTPVTRADGVGLRSRAFRSHSGLSEPYGADDSRLGRPAPAGWPRAIHRRRRDSITVVSLV